MEEAVFIVLILILRLPIASFPIIKLMVLEVGEFTVLRHLSQQSIIVLFQIIMLIMVAPSTTFKKPI